VEDAALWNNSYCLYLESGALKFKHKDNSGTVTTTEVGGGSTYTAGDGIDITNGVISATGGSGLSDAPSDGKTYGRLDGAWVDISAFVSNTTSYANPGGSQDRTDFVIATCSNDIFDNGATDASKLVDGINDPYSPQGQYSGTGAAVSGKIIQFVFDHAIIIDEAKWYQNYIGTNGTWKWQYSTDSGSNWTDIGSSFTLGDGCDTMVPQIMTTLHGHATRATYYRLLGISGNMSTQYILCIKFRISR
ncbi:MAG: hypothetical protein ACYC4Q_08375, partial [Victivallaceae bacterium]